MKIRHPPKIILSDSGFPLPTEVSLRSLLKEVSAAPGISVPSMSERGAASCPGSYTGSLVFTFAYANRLPTSGPLTTGTARK